MLPVRRGSWFTKLPQRFQKPMDRGAWWANPWGCRVRHYWAQASLPLPHVHQWQAFPKCRLSEMTPEPVPAGRLPSCSQPHVPWKPPSFHGRSCQISPRELASGLWRCLVSVWVWITVFAEPAFHASGLKALPQGVRSKGLCSGPELTDSDCCF